MWLCRSTISVAVLFLVLQILSQYKVSADGELCSNTINNSQGVCVDMKRCAPYVALLQKHGTAVADALRRTFCYYRDKQPIVCCPNSSGGSGKDYPDPQPVPTPTPRPTQPPLPTYNSTYGPLYAPTCGRSGKSQFNRVVGGQPAELGAYPWLAVLGYKNKKDPNKPKWLCGGSLISARHILTAGHCVYNRYDLYLARLGEHNLDRDDDGANPINVPIERGTIHPEYSSVNYVNDIAVLRLRREVAFTDAIHPLCLPVSPDIRNKNLERLMPFVAGWGALVFRGDPSPVLQEVQLPVISNADCKKAYAQFKNQIIDERVMCAGYPQGGQDACQGDSGGPLMYPLVDKARHSYTFYAVGIVSFGYRCAEVGFPGVYTRVTHYLDFIMSNLN